jgi:hypothetical protein
MMNTKIAPALAWTNLEFEITEENQTLMMGRPNYIEAARLAKIKDELQEIFFDLTDEGVEMKIDYLINGEHKSMGLSYISYLVHLEYPIYILDKIDVEEYALSLMEERGLPSYVTFFRKETTNELESPNKSMTLSELLKKDFSG